ncbi:allophanate hydrolase [Silicimonas algicola]|uniref:Allophanate hydrolase n=1 Tax=Silicimonas algicola TaxID=1826607 RepID=A0A316FXM5_9RHOB|nr:allophanate hydrolase [Silicimonas algicola]AZQ66734.1 allophanate hydrolase [Silicimonas algicola]PWK53153.1 allophanate hydrolase [Silicimonas algicola]
MTVLADTSFDFASLQAAFASGYSAADAVEEAYRRIALANDPGIFIHLRRKEDVLAEAHALPPFDPERFPLWGLPFAIKDNIDLAGVPTTAACPAFAYTAEADSFVVNLLRKAGAIPVGKTNLDQFATGLVGVRTPYPVPKNALDPAIVPGGSSSGSAVAVARGLVSFALGTDTAGSGRVPAALNNIVGLKPTLGALSATGVVPACRTLDTISIFALTVPDAWRVFSAAARYDDADGYSKRVVAPRMGAAESALRVGVPSAATRQFFGDTVQEQAFADTLARLSYLGATLVELDFKPFFDVAAMLYEGAWVAERMAAVETFMRERPDEIHPVTRQIIGAANRLSAADAFRGIYRLADLRRSAEGLMTGIDLLCVPTIPTFYTLADLEADPVTPNSRLGTYTNFVNLMDLCGIAVPTGLRADGRPSGVTLLARAGQDARAAAVAKGLHEDALPMLGATQLQVRPGDLGNPRPDPDECVIAVVGAHMSGLPLNHMLTELGGWFLESARTAADYRLYALPGGPPQRPGLLRSASGSTIALELWALPLRGLGPLLASVPGPLSIGSVTLSDDRCVKGFLMEAHAAEASDDITHFGGWRAYLASR